MITGVTYHQMVIHAFVMMAKFHRVFALAGPTSTPYSIINDHTPCFIRCYELMNFNQHGIEQVPAGTAPARIPPKTLKPFEKPFEHRFSLSKIKGSW